VIGWPAKSLGHPAPSAFPAGAAEPLESVDHPLGSPWTGRPVLYGRVRKREAFPSCPLHHQSAEDSLRPEVPPEHRHGELRLAPWSSSERDQSVGSLARPRAVQFPDLCRSLCRSLCPQKLPTHHLPRVYTSPLSPPASAPTVRPRTPAQRAPLWEHQRTRDLNRKDSIAPCLP
jgi:hypothetical protein